MSIILNALKKAQQQISPDPSPKASMARKNLLNQDISPKTALWMIITFSVLVIGMLAVLGKFLINSFQPRHKQTPAPHSLVQPETPSVKTESTEINPSLKVEGIISNNGKNAALINGQIYETGQSIAGMVITEIALEGIKISDGKTTRILTQAGR